MGYACGKSRYQTRITCLDDYVDRESIARFVDHFVEGLDLIELGFKNAVPKHLGRNPYNPAVLTKLLVYGYEEGIRSSRKLEKLTNINIEVMWLMDELKPDFKTIADFRKDNIEALTSLLSEYNSFADYCGLFGKELSAIDGTKIKANNNKKNNYSRKKLERNIEYNENRIKEYMERLAKSDDMDEATMLVEKIERHEKRNEKADEYLSILDKTGAGEISTSDHDARLMGNNRGGVDMAYNVQASVDSKAHLVAAFDITTNPTDHGQLTNMTEKTQEALRKKDMIVLADKGYYGTEDIAGSEALGAFAIVARQAKPGENKGSKYSIDKFVYDREKDSYICPKGMILSARSKIQTKSRVFFNKDACRDCPASRECLNGKDKYRRIIRRSDNDILDRADLRYRDYAETYKLRQQIVEHVFGTVKRTMNGGYFLLWNKRKVRVEVALLFLGYNIKRTSNALGFDEMMQRLDRWQQVLSAYGALAISRFLRNFSKWRTVGVF
jgi:transposase